MPMYSLVWPGFHVQKNIARGLNSVRHYSRRRVLLPTLLYPPYRFCCVVCCDGKMRVIYEPYTRYSGDMIFLLGYHRCVLSLLSSMKGHCDRNTRLHFKYTSQSASTLPICLRFLDLMRFIHVSYFYKDRKLWLLGCDTKPKDPLKNVAVMCPVG